MQREERAIVVAVEARGEHDRRVVLLTSAGELLDTHAPAARRSTRRFGGALQPGGLVSVTWQRRREGGVAVLEQAVLLTPPPHPDPLERYYVTAHLLETVASFAREGAEDPRLFRLLESTLARLAAGDPWPALCRYLEAWTLRLAGLLPEIACCAACGAGLTAGTVALAAERGAFCPAHAPPGALRISAAAAAWLISTRGATPADLPALPDPIDRALQQLLHALLRSFTDRESIAWQGLIAHRAPRPPRGPRAADPAARTPAPRDEDRTDR